MELSSAHSYLKINTTGALSFSCADGKILWEHHGPFLILHYYDRQHPREQVCAAPSGEGLAFGTAGTPSLSAKAELCMKLENEGSALRVTANFGNIQILITTTVRLTADGNGFSVSMDDADITEAMPGLYRILGIEILPEFGAARTSETGYLTLPNWSGCQTFFNKNYPREIRQTIYSGNDQWEHCCNMPVFGITRAQGTLCGLVTAGDFDAQLVSRVHWEHGHTNSTHPHLIYRWQQQDERIAGPREVRYAFAPADYGGGEGYVFCATMYREFLYEERGLKTWSQKAEIQKHPVVLDWRNRFLLKFFMAYKEPRADGRGRYHMTCTFSQVREILEDCLRRGLKKLCVILVGWGQDGHDGMPPKRFPVDERLGGEIAFRALITWCCKHDIMLGVHDSYGESYACSPEFDLADVIRHRTGEPWQGVIWSGGQVHKLCPKIYVEKHTKRDVPAIRALGIYGHHHIDAVGSFTTCFCKEHPLERRADFVKEVRTMFEFTRNTIGSVSTEMPFGPYFDVVDGFFHCYSHPSPWHCASPVGHWFLDRTIPLLHIALHGSVNCGDSIGNLCTDPLFWLDWGATPVWEVCADAVTDFGISDYASTADNLASIYELYHGNDTGGLLSRLHPLMIKGRWEIADGVARTLYSDGTVVTVNRATAKFNISHENLEARKN